jgi:hypothetical protein
MDQLKQDDSNRFDRSAGLGQGDERAITSEEQYLADIAAGKVQTPEGALDTATRNLQTRLFASASAFLGQDPSMQRLLAAQRRVTEFEQRAHKLCANIKERLPQAKRYEIYDKTHTYIAGLHEAMGGAYLHPQDGASLSTLESFLDQREQWIASQEELIGNQEWGSMLAEGLRPWPELHNFDLARLDAYEKRFGGLLREFAPLAASVEKSTQGLTPQDERYGGVVRMLTRQVMSATTVAQEISDYFVQARQAFNLDRPDQFKLMLSILTEVLEDFEGRVRMLEERLPGNE